MKHDSLATARTLGADIRALRKARGITLQELADYLGRSVGWISQVERDLSAPSVDDLRRMARFFKVPISILFGQPGAPAEEAASSFARVRGGRSGRAMAGLSKSCSRPT